MFMFLIFSDNRACVFPFNYWGVSHDRCSFHRADDMQNDKVIGNDMFLAVLTSSAQLRK